MAGGAANLAGLHDLLMLQAPANGSIAGPLLQQWPQQQQQHGDPSGRQQLPGLAALHPQPMHGAPATHVGPQQQQQISQQGLLQALAASGHSGLMHRLSQRSGHGLQAPDLAAVQTLLMPGGPVVHGHAPTNGHAGVMQPPGQLLANGLHSSELAALPQLLVPDTPGAHALQQQRYHSRQAALSHAGGVRPRMQHPAQQAGMDLHAPGLAELHDMLVLRAPSVGGHEERGQQQSEAGCGQVPAGVAVDQAAAEEEFAGGAGLTASGDLIHLREVWRCSCWHAAQACGDFCMHAYDQSWIWSPRSLAAVQMYYECQWRGRGACSHSPGYSGRWFTGIRAI